MFNYNNHMKDSNIQWIGEIPEHWNVNRIKDYLQFNIGGTPSTKVDEYFEGNNIWVSISDISKNNGEYIYDSSIKISNEGVRASNVKLIKKNSLLYSFKLSVGLTAFAGCDLYTNEAIASFEENEYVDLNFLKYILKDGFENNANENIYGAKLFNSDLIKSSQFAMPQDLNEQKQIANYLDKKTAKIDNIISKNKEIIQLLEEKRVSLINQVVTKGLNPNVSMKDSGVKWIGEIPEHWNVNRIKDYLQFNIGGTPSTKVDEYFEGNNIWVSISDISKNNGEYIYDSSIKISNEGVRASNVKLIKKNSLLYSFKLSVGLTAFAGCDLYTNEAIASFEENEYVDLNFLKYILKDGFENNANENIYGAKLFNSDLIKSSQFAMPQDLNEQKQIANYLDKKTAKIDNIISKNTENINLLEEYKTSLIHHVVTGKIDVRGEEV